ncbi:hypothetical protein [Pseudomonas chlororaphis]|uniref:hypothetical protein n=1 Tax=Pseudomonas chlororaphis TaxID=587753 RepID=UPI0019D1F332|nr:hypothetical protein [Pseudomonas chlororaphis]MBP5055389.1 hypothetical protein [Pseudomonas chlororaphis]MBP5144025.1 hypothetical protein [Pseudomonas chlororaphis]QTT98631.1 hypothetical protein HUT26_04945 [Pseudomonas chlororaphis]
MYLLHKRYATDPRHYVRAFLLLQKDVLDLFSYVEPSDKNIETYSHRIQQLLMRACVEVEANLTAIFLDNEYAAARGNLTMQQYRLIDISHRLSSYEIRVPTWQGSKGVRKPFHGWSLGGASLPWYQAYNKSKHNRHENFKLATFDALIDAFCGLSALLSAQFHDEDYSPGGKTLGLDGACYTYDGDDGMEPAIGGLLRVSFPSDWPQDQRYEFNWQQINALEDPFQNFDYTQYA